MLAVDNNQEGKARVELFERGYGKDAASIAKEAIAYGMKLDSCTVWCFLICL
jgi:signal recognition particle receptor subunit alpha